MTEAWCAERVHGARRERRVRDECTSYIQHNTFVAVARFVRSFVVRRSLAAGRVRHRGGVRRGGRGLAVHGLPVLGLLPVHRHRRGGLHGHLGRAALDGVELLFPVARAAAHEGEDEERDQARDGAAVLLVHEVAGLAVDLRRRREEEATSARRGFRAYHARRNSWKTRPSPTRARRSRTRGNGGTRTTTYCAPGGRATATCCICCPGCIMAGAEGEWRDPLDVSANITNINTRTDQILSTRGDLGRVPARRAR